MSRATVKFKNLTVGVLFQNESGIFFEFDSEFSQKKINLFPLILPVVSGTIRAASNLLTKQSFLGLHGPFSDSLPGQFGTDVMKKHFSKNGEDPNAIKVIQRLLFVGDNGMGALEYHPTEKDRDRRIALTLDARKLYEQSKKIIHGEIDEEIPEIIEISGSAGGARAKALVGVNRKNNTIISGTRDLPDGYEPSILKFDTESKDAGWGVVEYCYSQMARECGIIMSDTSLLTDSEGRSHFLTKRFDRTDNGEKAHMLSLSALTENDFNDQRSYDYDGMFRVALSLTGGSSFADQLFRRMVFNLVAINRDDHVKNFSFLMDKNFKWDLSPAYDLCFSYNGDWCSEHQLLVGGKFGSRIVRDDLLRFAEKHSVKNPNSIIDEIQNVVSGFNEFSDKNGASQQKKELVLKEIGQMSGNFAKSTKIHSEDRDFKQTTTLNDSNKKEICKICKNTELRGERRRKYGICSKCHPKYT